MLGMLTLAWIISGVIMVQKHFPLVKGKPDTNQLPSTHE